MKKLADINYALMAQLSYFHWNRIDRDKIDREILSEILFEENIISQIKTTFYDNPEHYPSNEKIEEKYGKLEEYTYHEEDKRLFLVYSLEKGKNKKAGKPLFENIIDGWEYLDCATGKIIQDRFFPAELLKGYRESGFFGVAFQRGNDIMIAYRGTEDKMKHNNILIPEDIVTDASIYLKKTDIQQVEAVLFYEYIKSKYGKDKNIHITGHSLAGAIAQYVHFYAYCNNDNVFTETWNGLGSFGSIITDLEFSLGEEKKERSEQTILVKDTQELFRNKLNSIVMYKESQKRLKKFYSLTRMELIKKREIVKNCSNLLNYFMHEDFVGGYFNGDWIGKKEVVDIQKNSIQDKVVNFKEKVEELKNKEISECLKGVVGNYTEFGKDIIYLIGKDSLKEVRRGVEKKLSVVEKTVSAFKFHNVNNFLAFMTDEGNINFYEMRKEFRCNALKTIVIKKEDKNYKFLKGKNRNNPNENILEIENKEIEKNIVLPANRLITGTVFNPFPITQTDILFKETFVKKRFSGEDMEIIRDKTDGVYNGEVILGKYNNLKELGGIIGQSPLVIKIYSLKSEEKIGRVDKAETRTEVIRKIYSAH